MHTNHVQAETSLLYPNKKPITRTDREIMSAVYNRSQTE